jgi:hypothetical protein
MRSHNNKQWLVRRGRGTFQWSSRINPTLEVVFVFLSWRSERSEIPTTSRASGCVCVIILFIFLLICIVLQGRPDIFALPPGHFCPPPRTFLSALGIFALPKVYLKTMGEVNLSLICLANILMYYLYIEFFRQRFEPSSNSADIAVV